MIYKFALSLLFFSSLSLMSFNKNIYALTIRAETLEEGWQFLQERYENSPQPLGITQETFKEACYKEETYTPVLESCKGLRLPLQNLLTLNPFSFTILPSYELIFTHYREMAFSQEGKIYIPCLPGKPLDQTLIRNALAHNIIHIGIEETVAQPLGFSNEEREELVNLLCEHLNVEGYEPNVEPSSMEHFFTHETIKDNLSVIGSLYRGINPRLEDQ